MRKSYRHLGEQERGVIYRMRKAGKTQTEIAEAIGFSQSAVSKEMIRNCGLRSYRPKQAQEKALERKRSKARRRRKLECDLQELVESRVMMKHSPEQISGALAKSGIEISHETIYRHIAADKKAGGELFRQLRINGRRRYRRRNRAGRDNKVPDRKGLEKRPKVVDRRARYGDWEADLIEGAKGSGFLLSLYERKSRLGLLIRLSSKEASSTAHEIIRALKRYRVRTITYDNGLEFSKHGEVSKALKAEGYFCQPYHSWEKGGVENFNGLVRQYFPKGSDFCSITPERLKDVEKEINERPRKILNFKSPAELKSKLAA